MRISLFVGMLALAVLPVLAQAADPVPSPTTRDIIDALKPAAQQPHLRGISVEEPKPPPSIDMRVNFEFNSAKLTADTLESLDHLGEALNSKELVVSRFQIAGHTDAVGGADFNQALSEHRARAVKAYLAKRGVKAQRLSTIGFGKSRLLDPTHPDAAINRRVQITNVGPAEAR